MIAHDKLIIRTIQIGLLVALFGAWYLVTRSGAPTLRLFLPAPELVWREMGVLVEKGLLWSALAVTVSSIAKAYAIAVTAGIAVGFVVARSRTLVHMFEPVLSGMFAVPLTMFFPLFVLFFGIGTESKVAYGATYALFPIALNTIAAFSNVDETYLRASRAMGASGLQQFRHVYLPAALPVTLTGLRIGFFICIASVLGGETLAATAGVGRATAHAAELMETARLYAWIAFVVCMSVMLNLLALAVETRSERGEGGMSANAIRAVRLSLILAVILLWEFYARVIATSLLTVAPSEVLEQVWPKVLGEPNVRIAIGWTLFEMVVAFLMSVVFGMLIGVLVGLSNIGRRSFYPIVLLLYGIPQAILLPLFVLIFGLGPEGKIAFGFSHGVFPVIVNTIAGMRNVNPLLLHGAASMGATRLEQLRYVMFPHMVTAVFTGLRLAMTLTLLGVLLAELFVSQGGIGAFTLTYADSRNPAALMALILTLALLAIVLNELVRMVEAHYSRWKE